MMACAEPFAMFFRDLVGPYLQKNNGKTDQM